MKKLIPFLLIFSMVLWTGCGDDEDPVGPGDTTPSVRANTTAAGPNFSSVDEAVWATVATTALDISTANAPKPAVGKIAAVSDSIYVQAIRTDDSLFLRLRYSDPTFSVWKDHYATISSTPPINFVHNDLGYDEDQVYVMFDDGNDGWDVWNWRVLTTGEGGLAEGMTYTGGVLATDEGTITVAITNPGLGGSPQPTYVHVDTSDFHGYVLVRDLDSLTELYVNTTGWTVGQMVPGWIIDRFLKNDEDQSVRRKSRFDIRAVSDYDEGAEEYVVVLGRALATGYDDDLDMSELTSVRTMIGQFDNQDVFSVGGTGRGFTVEFNLILQ